MSAEQLAKNAVDSLGIDFGRKDYTFEDLVAGTEVEMKEHGENVYDVIGKDKTKAAFIAAAHLAERGDYYDGLEVVESAPKGYWKNKNADRYIKIVEYMRYALILVIILTIMIIFIGFEEQNIWAVFFAAASSLAFYALFMFE